MTNNAELLKRRTAAVPRGVSTATTLFVDRAENAEIWDVEGRRYIDFAAGIAVLNTGHRHPRGDRGGAGAAGSLHPHRLPGARPTSPTSNWPSA